VLCHEVGRDTEESLGVEGGQFLVAAFLRDSIFQLPGQNLWEDMRSVCLLSPIFAWKTLLFAPLSGHRVDASDCGTST
jgi:hypothetical protein